MNTETCFIAGLLLVLFSPLLGVLAGLKWNRRKSQETTLWSRTQGVIEESTVRDPMLDEHPGKYHARVRYAYQVGGATLRNDEIWLNSRHEAKTFDQADLIAERYFAGRHVTVFFDPQHPERAVLEPGFHAGAYLDAYRSVWMFALLPSFVLVLLFLMWLTQFMK